MRVLFVRLLMVGMAAAAALVVAPGSASAAHGATPFTASAAALVTPGKAVPQQQPGFTKPARTGAGITTNSVFTCKYGGVAPFYYVDFLCNVSSGAITLTLDCSDGQRYFSQVLTGPGQYRLRGICGPPAQVVNFGYVEA